MSMMVFLIIPANSAACPGGERVRQEISGEGVAGRRARWRGRYRDRSVDRLPPSGEIEDRLP
jgi:hypothetical protein